MKIRRLFKYHSLKKKPIRPTWNKYNLYNLATAGREPRIISKTFFQQKWLAKSMTRAYHGEHIKERKWARMFSRRLPAVVNMDPAYMAKYDGSEQAAGRGSGLSEPPAYEKTDDGKPAKQVIANPGRKVTTPYEQMTFAPLERRLDIAIFRALFASSARQARQMVVHGAVTVNGKKMKHPGYLLNPGDLFQVDVERVLYATGAPKDKKLLAAAMKAAKKELAEEAQEAVEEEEAEAEEEEGDAQEATSKSGKKEKQADTSKFDEAWNRKYELLQLQRLLQYAKHIADSPSHQLSATRKQALRALKRDIKAAIKQAQRRDGSVVPTGNVVDDLTMLLERLAVSPSKAIQQEDAAKELSKKLDKQSSQVLKKVIEYNDEHEDSEIDPSKPYMTPWRPRNYMSAFAFVPRYLEVNQNICAAVYLRHPVARPGESEVPSPFSPTINQLAFNWYLRRG
ncbi:hypothetical protein B0H65DRAFT_297303 [Neurospora tetraspora]|uniref:Small ribosomal subunit protein uS4m n=1 Tax=Neurospora tetraspora TaxID=94610 RepID=A0AAE0MQ22_9PEZI|nr:hypothetical protein B0H65DRAFT_297303 [Neurospora tetraspora]